jgi:hypothetical protein
LADLPTNFTGNPMTTYEGCFSISDANGDLLFFSDGTNVWNKNMQNLLVSGTLTGNRSSAQSGSIVMYPGEINKYIALTLGEHGANNLSYTVVDMTLNGGLGATSGTRNILFTGQQGILGETVTAGRHSNKTDLWVLAVGRSTENTPTVSSSSFLNVWKVTTAGPDTNIHSSVQIPNTPTYKNNPGGYIRFSPDSKHFAWINFGKTANSYTSPIDSFICYGDFDNENGIISNVKVKKINYANSYGYGVEFTNDSKYLYLTFAPDNLTGTFGSALIVFDFTVLNAASDPTTVSPIKEIRNEPANVANLNNYNFGAIQSGPDGRMYITKMFDKALFVIDNPKDPTNLRMYKYDFNINGVVPSQTVYWGLPNFAVPWFTTAIEIPIPPNGICVNQTIPINFFIVDGEGFEDVAKIIVDYGDGTPQQIYDPATAGIKNETHTYKNPGIYTISATAYNVDNTVNTVVDKTIIINSCQIKVNPFIRGEFKN